MPIFKVALFYKGEELQAEWYKRKASCPSVTWSVRTTQPWSKESWPVDAIAMFDPNGNLESSRPMEEIILRGAVTTSFTPEQIAYRKKYGMPLEIDPHQGDTFTVTIDLGVDS